MLAPFERASENLGKRVKLRAFLVVLAFFICAGTAWKLRVGLFTFLLIPADGALSPFDGLPVYTTPTGMMGATFGLAGKAGIAGAVPVAIVSVLTLIKPLTGPYWRFIVLFTASVMLSFVGGAAFSYYVLLPTAMGFLLHFGEGVAVPVIDITEYLALFTAIVFWLGVIFTMPPVMFLLTKFRFVEYRTFRAPMVRKLGYLAMIAFSAIITPSLDPWLTMLVAAPMIALYEVGVFVSWLAHPEEGNYLWLKTVASGVRKAGRALTWAWRKTGIPWAYRKARSILKFMYGEFF